MIEPSLETTAFVVTFKALPATVPAAVRVRHMLKYALRAQNLKCLRIVPAVEETPPAKEPNP